MRPFLSPLQVVNVAALPAAGQSGRVVFLTTDKDFYGDNGTAWDNLTTSPRTVLPGDVANSNALANTLADVTGLSFAVASGIKYKFKFFVVYTAAATTTGSRWTINAPAATFLHYRSDYSLTAALRTINDGLNAVNLPAASNASSASTASNITIIEGVIQPSAAGVVIARFASEVAASAITAKGGMSYVEYEIIG